MTPKQEAKELIEQFKPYVYCFLGSGMLTNTEDEDVITLNARRCALICAEKLIEQTGKKHYYEVKKEIENYENQVIKED